MLMVGVALGAAETVGACVGIYDGADEGTAEKEGALVDGLLLGTGVVRGPVTNSVQFNALQS